MSNTKTLQEEIRKLAIEKYGDNPNLYGGQRDGFVEGYLQAKLEYAQSPSEGKTDRHPEDYCHKCGSDNPIWYAPNDLFNIVNGSPNGIMCPVCFQKMAEEKDISVVFTVENRSDGKAVSLEELSSNEHALEDIIRGTISQFKIYGSVNEAQLKRIISECYYIISKTTSDGKDILQRAGNYSAEAEKVIGVSAHPKTASFNGFIAGWEAAILFAQQQPGREWIRTSKETPSLGRRIVARRLILPTHDFKYFTDVFSTDTNYFDEWMYLPE